MNIHIINGPNLNLVGQREPNTYGEESLRDACKVWRQTFPEVTLHCHFSNQEGDLIDWLHAHGFDADGIILNPGGYTHTSVALRDAVAAISSPVIEVHISNPQSREAFRHQSLIASVAKGTISGLGLAGYELALRWFAEQ